MRIFVPYTKITPATAMVLMGYRYEPVYMVKDNSYIEYFLDRWREGESFINIEHDTVFWCGAIEELLKCNKEWCAYGLDDNPNNLFTSGCPASFNLMKFEASFIHEYPVWHDVYEAKKKDITPMWHLDSFFNKEMLNYDVICHQHFPHVLNANPSRVDVHIGPKT